MPDRSCYHVCGDLQLSWSYRDDLGIWTERRELITIDARIVGVASPTQAMERARSSTYRAIDIWTANLHWASVPIVEEQCDA